MRAFRPLNSTYWHNDCEKVQLVSKGRFSFPGYILGEEISICLKLFRFIPIGTWGMENIASSRLFWSCGIIKKNAKLLLKCSQSCYRDAELYSECSCPICLNSAPTMK